MTASDGTNHHGGHRGNCIERGPRTTGGAKLHSGKLKPGRARSDRKTLQSNRTMRRGARRKGDDPRERGGGTSEKRGVCERHQQDFTALVIKSTVPKAGNPPLPRGTW